MQEQEQNYKISNREGASKRIQKRNVFDTQSQVLTTRFDPEDTMIAAGCADGSLKIYHLHSGHLKLNVQTSGQGNPSNSSPCTCIRWRPPQYSDKTKNVLVTAGADGKIIHWHVTTGKELCSIKEETNQINCMDFNQDGSQFVTAGSDCIIRVYDEETQQVTTELKATGWQNPGHSNRIFCTKFIPEQPHLILSGGWDSNVHFWDQREKKSVKSFLGPKVSGESIDYKQGKILTGSNNAKQQLAIWDFDSCEKIQDIDWEPGEKKENGAFVYGCQWSKVSNESILVGAHGVNSARIYDIENNFTPYGSIEGLKNGIFTIDYGNFSNKFAAAGGDGLIFVSSLTNEKE